MRTAPEISPAPLGHYSREHVWTPIGQAFFEIRLPVQCAHVSGLFVAAESAGPDEVRRSWSLSILRI